MTVDPREGRLPKWAQELLKRERIRAALHWPAESDPLPSHIFDTNGYRSGGDAGAPPYDREEMWKIAGGVRLGGFSSNYFPIRYLWDGRRHVYESDRKAAQRPEGAYYATRAETLWAIRWLIARQCAELLYEVRN